MLKTVTILSLWLLFVTLKSKINTCNVNPVTGQMCSIDKVTLKNVTVWSLPRWSRGCQTSAPTHIISRCLQGTDVKKVHDVISVFRGDITSMMSVLLDEIAKLMKLIMVLSSSSSSAERLFSTLRRLKTYIRSTMTADRLNLVTILHIHKELTADLKHRWPIMKEFVSANDTTRAMFGAV